jgi:hypothetical protein
MNKSCGVIAGVVLFLIAAVREFFCLPVCVCVCVCVERLTYE